MRGGSIDSAAGVGYLEIEVRGPSREIGRQVGEAARDLMRESIAYYEEHHEVMAGMSFADAERECEGYLTHARRWVPHVVEELEGMAEASAIPLSKLLVPNCGEELTCSDEAALLAAEAPAQHCTSFAIMAGGRKLVGHNEDWYSDDVRRNVLLKMRLMDGTQVVAITAACLLAATGINSHGIATGCNTLFCNDTRGGVPNNFIRHWMLEAKDLESALQRACLPARARGANHLLADKNGRIWDVETSATTALTLESGSSLVHTNHYVHDAMLPYQMRLSFESSQARYARAEGLIGAGLARGADPRALALAVLSDHGNGDLAICSHEDESLPPGERQSTTASMLWDLEAMTAEVCAGQPCENARQTIRVTRDVGSGSRR